MLLCSGGFSLPAQDARSKAAQLPLFTRSFQSSILTEEEYYFHRPVVFPLSLGERGRFLAMSPAGMPPQFLTYQFNGFEFVQPYHGFWDLQTIPTYRATGRRIRPDLQGLRETAARLVRRKPRTRVLFSQDYITGLSYLDVDFQKALKGDDYVHLGGGNFVRDGTLGAEFSRIKVTTYQAMWHHRLSERWRVMASFWQLWHRYRLRPEDASAFRGDKFKTLNNLAWVSLEGALGPKDSLRIVPSVEFLEDNYWRAGEMQRSIRSRVATVKAVYRHRFYRTQVGLALKVAHVRGSGIIHWRTRREALLELKPFFQRHMGSLQLIAGVSLFAHSQLNTRGGARLALEWQVSPSLKLAFHGNRSHRPTPLLWRSIEDSLIQPVTSNRPLQATSLVLSGQYARPGKLKLSGGVFYLEMSDYPSLNEAAGAWQMRRWVNRGGWVEAAAALGPFTLTEALTWNQNYRQVLAPFLENSATLSLKTSLFRKKLKLKGALIWRTIGRRQLVTFNRLLSFYTPGSESAAVSHIVDGRIHAHIGDAYLFFVWENLLSTNFQIVQGTVEQFRLFRLGVDWVLFD